MRAPFKHGDCSYKCLRGQGLSPLLRKRDSLSLSAGGKLPKSTIHRLLCGEQQIHHVAFWDGWRQLKLQFFGVNVRCVGAIVEMVGELHEQVLEA
jgi:hypothetical protein